MFNGKVVSRLSTKCLSCKRRASKSVEQFHSSLSTGTTEVNNLHLPMAP